MALVFGSDFHPMERHLSYSRYPEDQYEQQVIDPHYARHMTRYLRPPLEYRCCEKCVGRLTNAVQTLPGVENVIFDEYDEVLKITGSTDPDVIHQAVKYARKSNPGHYHYWPRKLHLLDRNPFRSSMYDTQYYQNRYAAGPVRYRTSYYGTSHTPSYLYENGTSHTPSYLYENGAFWRYGDGYGPSFGYATRSPYSTPVAFDSLTPSRFSYY